MMLPIKNKTKMFWICVVYEEVLNVHIKLLKKKEKKIGIKST